MKRLLHIIVLACLSVYSFAEETSTSINQSAVDYGQNLTQMMLGLGLTIVLIFIMVWLIKRFGYSNHPAMGAMKIKSCLSLSPKEKLFLIEVGDEQLLIGSAPGYVGYIKNLDKPMLDNSTTNNPMATTFADKLKDLLAKDTLGNESKE